MASRKIISDQSISCRLCVPPADPSVRAMSQDRPVLGILLMLGFCIVAPMGDAVAKLIGQSVSLGLMLVIRFGMQAALLMPLTLATGRLWRMRGRILWLTVLRTFMHILGIGLMFTALQYLPLADAIAIAFVMPFILLLLGHVVLKEEVGPRRIIACLIGFCGTLMVVQPSFQEVGWPALLPLGVAVNFSFFMLTTRLIAKETDPIGLQAVSGLMATAVLVPVVAWGGNSGWAVLEVHAPDAWEWMLLLSIGTLGTAAHLLMTWSLRYAPSATLAPMQYLEIPFATIIGWIIFRDLPDGLAAIGSVITIAAGLYVIVRERISASELAMQAAEVPPAPSTSASAPVRAGVSARRSLASMPGAAVLPAVPARRFRSRPDRSHGSRSRSEPRG